MKNKAVSFQKEGRVGIITLNRPDAKNAICRQVVAELLEIRDEVGYGSDFSVLVLTGAGHQAFSMGTDQREKNGEGDIAGLKAAAVIGSFDRPVIAAVNGDAMGQGLEILLACDVRISSETANFSMNHILNNEIPWDGGTQRLSRLVGRGKALEMILGGGTLDAAGALDIGLINKVVSREEVMPLVLKTAVEMAGKGPVALRYAKEAILRGLDMTREQGFRLEADLYFLLHTTDDRTEGITAFREKRKPRFEGK
jgi:enoyl-CoA hydratase